MKWIFVEQIFTPWKKTAEWEVFSKEGGSLGIIKWKANWRKYAFFPYDHAYFEQTCMRELADFIEQETKEYKKDWYKL